MTGLLKSEGYCQRCEVGSVSDGMPHKHTFLLLPSHEGEALGVLRRPMVVAAEQQQAVALVAAILLALALGPCLVRSEEVAWWLELVPLVLLGEGVDERRALAIV